MLLDLKPIMAVPGDSVSFLESFDLSDLCYGVSFPVTEPVTAQGTVRNTAGVLIMKGTVSTRIHGICDRCAADFQRDVSFPIDAVLVTELSSDLIPTLVAAVSYEGKDPLELSAFVNDALSIELEGINGVASVTKTGLVLQRIEIELDEDKIDALNKKLYAAI